MQAHVRIQEHRMQEKHTHTNTYQVHVITFILIYILLIRTSCVVYVQNHANIIYLYMTFVTRDKH